MEHTPIAPDPAASNAVTSNAATSNGPVSGRTTLTRTTGTGMVGGVCAGLADYFDVDPILVRAVFVAGAFMSGFSLVLYLVLWVALDDADRQAVDGPADSDPPDASTVQLTEVPYPTDTDVK